MHGPDTRGTSRERMGRNIHMGYRGTGKLRKYRGAVIVTVLLLISLCGCNSNTEDNKELPDNTQQNVENTINDNSISKESLDKIYNDTLKQVILDTYEDKNDETTDDTENIEDNEEIDQDVTPENVENRQADQQSSTKMESDIQNIMDDTISESEYYGGVTRYQCATLVYDILSIQNKIPDLTGYILPYIDDIPERYLIHICVLDKLGIRYGDQFSGYTTVSSDEMQEIFSKIADYIKNYKENSNNDNDDDLENNKDIDKEVTEIESSDYTDTLFGESVAVFKHPTTSNEVSANIDAIIPVDTDSSSTISKYDNYEPVNAQYINLYEALVNPDDIGKILDGRTDSSEIIGVSKVSSIHLSVSSNVTSRNGTVYESSLFEIGNVPIFTQNYGCVGIKNNKATISLSCEMSPDGTNIITIPDGTDIDTIGFIVDKLTFENHSMQIDESTGEIIPAKILVLAEIA